LVFGVGANWKPLPSSDAVRYAIVNIACQALALAVGWIAYPILRDLVAWITRALAVQQPWLSWCHFFVSSRMMTAAFCALAFALVAHALHGRKIAERGHPLGSPYFLGPRPEFGEPLLQFKEPYVDPFE